MNKITKRHVAKFALARKRPVSSPRKNALDLYQTLASKSAIYPGKGTPIGLSYVALKLNGEAGEFAEHVGKAMRDDYIVTLGSNIRSGRADVYFRLLSDERRLALVKEIGDMLWYLSAACNELDIKLSEAALINLIKLADRTKRNKLGGSGDNR